MLIKRHYFEEGTCDYCGVDGIDHAAISRGATGRWCEVLWFCKECAEQQINHGTKAHLVEDARDMIEREFPNDWADF